LTNIRVIAKFNAGRGASVEKIDSFGVPYEIRTLQPGDWEIWKDIRLEALKFHPEAFLNSYEEESRWSDEGFKQDLIKTVVFGAFVDTRLVGVIEFMPFEQNKAKHKGTILGIYLKPENRGQGIAGELVNSVIEYARGKILQLYTTAVTDNASGMRLYQKHGFEVYGTEVRSLCVDGKFYDERLMMLKLDMSTA
jgi:RimJ/RimL family protein N-acetyltransferase